MFARPNPVGIGMPYNRQPAIRQAGATVASQDQYLRPSWTGPGAPNRLGAGTATRMGVTGAAFGQARRNVDAPVIPDVTEDDALPLRFVKKDETTMSTALLVFLVIALVGLGGLSLWLLMKKK